MIKHGQVQLFHICRRFPQLILLALFLSLSLPAGGGHPLRSRRRSASLLVPAETDGRSARRGAVPQRSKVVIIKSGILGGFDLRVSLLYKYMSNSFPHYTRLASTHTHTR